MGKLLRRLTIGALVLSAACTTSQQTAPPIGGPSELALSLRVTATPDSISQDGASQSAVVVRAFDANGRPCGALPVRVDMAVNGQIQDFGTLSARNVVTGSDGSTMTVYTAPLPPPPAAGGAGTTVLILATPSSSYQCGSNNPVGNFDATNMQMTSIRLVPPGVILPAANTPTARFTFPTPVNANANTLFDGSSSCPRGIDASSVCLPPSSAGASITNYSWNFGDGGTATGQTATHRFSSIGTFNVTLTVTNDRGVAGSSSQQVTVEVTEKPSVDFVWSPQPVLAKATTTFNGAISVAAAGHKIDSYSWDFGDGTGGSGPSVTHVYQVAQTYKVVLTVTDDTGQQSTTAKDIAVLTGNPLPAATSSPGNASSHTVNLDGSASQAFGGASIASYSWACNNAAADVKFGVKVSCDYQGAGAFTAQLTVTDSLGRSATTTVSVTAP